MAVIFYYVLLFVVTMCTISAIILGKSTFILTGIFGVTFLTVCILKRNLKSRYKIVDAVYIVSSLGITIPFIYRFIR